MSYISLPKLVELKLASGMTNPGRLKDLSDVLELIKVLNLTADFGDQLDPYVRPKFSDLWRDSKAPETHGADDDWTDFDGTEK